MSRKYPGNAVENRWILRQIQTETCFIRQSRETMHHLNLYSGQAVKTNARSTGAVSYCSGRFIRFINIQEMMSKDTGF